MIEQVIILSSVLGVLIGVLIRIKTKGKGEWKLAVSKNLSELSERIKTNDYHILKSTLLDADKLLDHTMKKRRIKGESMGERLKNAKKHFEWNEYQQIWDAHKVRNKLVHEMEHTANDQAIRKAFEDLRRGINKLM